MLGFTVTASRLHRETSGTARGPAAKKAEAARDLQQQGPMRQIAKKMGLLHVVSAQVAAQGGGDAVRSFRIPTFLIHRYAQAKTALPWLHVCPCRLQDGGFRNTPVVSISDCVCADYSDSPIRTDCEHEGKSIPQENAQSVAPTVYRPWRDCKRAAERRIRE